MTVRLLLKIAALASTCWLGINQACAENRIALVIGNASYKTVTALPNPANDAKAMTRFLTSSGFQVMQAPDLTQADMRRTISNFASMVAEKGPDTVALVFYAGHGLQVDGENYLVPVDASIQREADVPLQATRLADLMNALASVPSKTKLVILDACRNNPFSDINKTTGRGLAIVDAPSGSLVSYSTAPGTEARDGDGGNSPFTSALIRFAGEPGLPIEQVLKRVRLAVNEATDKMQTPWESSSLTNEFTFVQPAAGKAQAKVASAATAASAITAASASGVASASTAASGGMAATTVAATTVAAHPETRSVESWQKELKAQSPKEAYETVIREDKVEAYQAYLALYPNQSTATVVRSIVERRQLMIAWYEAVTVNTPASYQAFLAAYGSSDFVTTANRLSERARTRSVSNALAAFASAANTCPCSQPTIPQNNSPRGLPRRADALPPAGNGAPNTGAPVTGPTRVAASAPVITPVPVITPPAVIAPVPVITPVPVYDPPVRVRVHLPPGRVPTDWPRGDKPYPKGGDGKPPYTGGGKPPYPHGDSKPTGDGQPTRQMGDGKPPVTGRGYPPVTGANGKPPVTGTNGKPPITGTNGKPPITSGNGRLSQPGGDRYPGKSIKMMKPGMTNATSSGAMKSYRGVSTRSVMMNRMSPRQTMYRSMGPRPVTAYRGMGARPMMMNRMSMGSRPMMNRMSMGARPGFRMGGFGGGRRFF